MSKLGKVVKVGKTSAHKANGEVYLKSARPIFKKIVQVYIGGKVLLENGDLWKIKLNPNQSESDYVIDEA